MMYLSLFWFLVFIVKEVVGEAWILVEELSLGHINSMIEPSMAHGSDIWWMEREQKGSNDVTLIIHYLSIE